MWENVLRRLLKKFLSKTAAFKQRSEGYIELDYEKFFNRNDYVRENRIEEGIGLKQTNKKKLLTHGPEQNQSSRSIGPEGKSLWEKAGE